jgi:hypothetical protein
MSYILPYDSSISSGLLMAESVNDENLDGRASARPLAVYDSPSSSDEDYVVSYDVGYEHTFVPTGGDGYIEKETAMTSTVSSKAEPTVVENNVYIHWDGLTHFYFASLTVVSLFVMFRAIQKSS